MECIFLQITGIKYIFSFVYYVLCVQSCANVIYLYLKAAVSVVLYLAVLLRIL